MHATIIAQQARHTPEKSARHSTQGRTPPDRAARRKTQLVTLGLQCISLGEWQMTMALTRIIRERGWGHG
jgi:hypothetical protein